MYCVDMGVQVKAEKRLLQTETSQAFVNLQGVDLLADPAFDGPGPLDFVLGYSLFPTLN